MQPVHGGTGDRGGNMKRLMKMEDREISQGSVRKESDKITEYRNRIADESYLDHAISKIAADLSHYLTK